MGNITGSAIIINANKITSVEPNAPESNITSVKGYSVLSGHTVDSPNSQVTIRSEVAHEGLNYSANRIIGIEGASFGRLGGSLTVQSNASQNAVVIGVHIDGTQASADHYQHHFINVQLDQLSNSEVLTEKNSGGTKYGYFTEKSTIANIESTIKVTGERVYGHLLRDNSLVTRSSANITATGSTKDVYGIYIGANDNSHIQDLSATIIADNTYKGTDASDAAISFDIDSFDYMGYYGAENESKGDHSAIGYHLFTDHAAAGGVQESGWIFSDLDVSVAEAYYYSRDNTDGTAAQDRHHWKSATGIQIEAREGTTSRGTEAVINLGDGASVETAIGTKGDIGNNALGDVLAFDATTATLNAVTKNPAKSYLNLDASVAENLDLDAQGRVTLRGDIVYTGDDIGKDKVIFRQGIYDVSSNDWYVTQAAIGDERTRDTSVVNLLESTHLHDTERLSFHVNAPSDHSRINVVYCKFMTITEINTVDIYLGTEIMQAEQFRVTLVDGDMLDKHTGELTFMLHDLEDALLAPNGLAYELDTITIIYGEQEVQYTRGGLTLQLDGSATDLVIIRGPGDTPDPNIPEPSTATLSLLALATILTRRRRKK